MKRKLDADERRFYGSHADLLEIVINNRENY